MDISHYLCDMLPRAIAVTLGSLVRIGEDGKLPSEPPTALDASTGQNVPAIHGIDSNAIDMGIKRTFLITDNCALYEGLDYANRPGVCKTTLIPHLGMALSGASALVTFYEPSSQLLKVALTGNSGAVLGRPVQREDGTQEYDVYPLTSPHTASNPTEMARLNALLRSDAQAICRSVSDSESAGANTADNSVDMDTDPEVESIFNKLRHSLYDPNGKIFGTGVTRAFGLAAYKWSYELQRYIHSDYLGYNDIPLPSSDTVNTPSYPYLTAEPEITTVQVQPGDVLVMGTSGLWKALSNEEVVGLVGAWANLSEDARIDIEQHDGVLVTSEQQLSQEVGTGEGLEPPSSLTSSTVLPSRIFTFKDLPLRHTSSPSSPSPILSSPASLSSLPFSASPPHPLSTNCLAAQNSQHSLANTHPPSHTKSASLSPPISLDESQPLSPPHPPSPPPLSTQSKPLYHHQSKSLEKQFVCIDNNAARHIVRNALGGLDDDLVTTVINLDEYRAQKVRDSINVIVVFF
ncbi:hypothetical protein AX16_010926 [Volvariella volvacea WC 439]|nr:hypothetical protein AX16_010926 [Volvariella volvacea WC 439]